jgi:hypothetical protein
VGREVNDTVVVEFSLFNSGLACSLAEMNFTFRHAKAEGSTSPSQLPLIAWLLKFKQKIAVLIGYHN